MRKVLLILCFWSILGLSSMAQQVKVVSFPQFVSNSLVVFTKYVNWPMHHKNGDFIISVVGDTEVFKELSGVSQGLTVGAQKISVRYYAKATDIEGFSHIIYVSDKASSSFRKITEKIGTDNTLLVTSSEGLLVSGAGINFIPQDGYMKFELSKNNIHKRNLEIHSWLEKMALKS